MKNIVIVGGLFYITPNPVLEAHANSVIDIMESGPKPRKPSDFGRRSKGERKRNKRDRWA